MSGDEELCHRDERVEERTHPEHDEQDFEDLPARRLRRGDRPDGRDCVERPYEGGPGRGILGDDEAQRSGNEQQTDDSAELREPAEEQRDLPFNLNRRGRPRLLWPVAARPAGPRTSWCHHVASCRGALGGQYVATDACVGQKPSPIPVLNPAAERMTSRMPTIPTGRSPSTTGK